MADVEDVADAEDMVDVEGMADMERGRCEPLVAGSQRPLVSPEDVPQEPVARPIPASPGTRSRGQELTCAATALEKVVSRV
jgi:hypothetical protein